ncbi:MAG: prepilin peptidase [Porticoccaceae bacterium]|nr:prepilin peptidase [Porticoccaceae bacterium]
MTGGIESYPIEILATVALVFGLLIGSFLNVVIYRLPLQLQLAWRSEALDFLGQKPELDHDPTKQPSNKFSLVHPPSRCPHCETLIKPWQNIPVISYLILRGKCKACSAAISIRYPAVELVCGLMSAFVIFHFGFTGQGLFALLFTWMLIALTGIDLNHQLLPDNLTLPLLWLGLLINTGGVYTDLSSAVIGAAAGYLSLWSVYWAFKLITGKEGMGHGDFKLLAALGAWLGWQQLPLIVLLSSVVGVVIGTLILLLQKKDRQNAIAFGPYLAIAGWIALLAGEKITSSYLSTF